jgi:hypothetical protein
MPLVSPAPANEANDQWLRDFDMSLNWTYKIKERGELQPGVGFFNLFNFANFDGPKNTLSGVLSLAGTPAVVGTAQRNARTPALEPAGRAGVRRVRAGLAHGWWSSRSRLASSTRF